MNVYFFKLLVYFFKEPQERPVVDPCLELPSNTDEDSSWSCLTLK